MNDDVDMVATLVLAQKDLHATLGNLIDRLDYQTKRADRYAEALRSIQAEFASWDELDPVVQIARAALADDGGAR